MPNFGPIGAQVQEHTALALATALPGGRLKRLVAQATGRSPDYVRECCLIGRLYPPLDVLQAALDLTEDPALFNLFETERYHMVPKAQAGITTDDLLLLLARKGAAGGRVQEVFARILDPESEGGSGITNPERAEAKEALGRLKRQVALLEEALEKA